MGKLMLVAALGLASVLGGCNTTSVLQGGTSITAPIQNPVGRRELAVIESSYGATLAAAVNYRRLGLCRRGETESLENLCARRGVVLALQAADRKAHAAIVAARNFVRNNPTISALSAIDAARAAVSDFQAVAATYGVK